MNLPVSLGFMGFFWISRKVELQLISVGMNLPVSLGFMGFLDFTKSGVAVDLCRLRPQIGIPLLV